MLRGTAQELNAAITHGISYTPDENFHGKDTLTLTASDAPCSQTTEHVEITVTPVNDEPPDAGDVTLKVNLLQRLSFETLPDFDGWRSTRPPRIHSKSVS